MRMEYKSFGILDSELIVNVLVCLCIFQMVYYTPIKLGENFLDFSCLEGRSCNRSQRETMDRM